MPDKEEKTTEATNAVIVATQNTQDFAITTGNLAVGTLVGGAGILFSAGLTVTSAPFLVILLIPLVVDVIASTIATLNTNKNNQISESQLAHIITSGLDGFTTYGIPVGFYSVASALSSSKIGAGRNPAILVSLLFVASFTKSRINGNGLDEQMKEDIKESAVVVLNTVKKMVDPASAVGLVLLFVILVSVIIKLNIEVIN